MIQIVFFVEEGVKLHFLMVRLYHVRVAEFIVHNVLRDMLIELKRKETFIRLYLFRLRPGLLRLSEIMTRLSNVDRVVAVEDVIRVVVREQPNAKDVGVQVAQQWGDRVFAARVAAGG